MSQNVIDYFELLARHDWYYEFSDDHRYWSSGNASWRKIVLMAQQERLFDRMKNDFVNWKFKKGPEPKLEDYTEDTHGHI